MSFRPVTLNRMASRPLSRPPTNGMIPCALNWITNDLGQIQNTTGQQTEGTVRIQYQTTVDVSEVAFVFEDWASNISGNTLFGEQLLNLGPVTYSTPYLEVGANFFPLFFGNSGSTTNTAVMNPGDMLVTNPLKIFLPAGTTVFLRYFQVVPNNTWVPGNTQAQYFANGTWSNLAPGTTTPNLTAAIGTTGLVQQAVYSQCMGMIGTPTAGTNPVSVSIMGDSIASGFTTTNGYFSAAVLALVAAGIPFHKGSCGGDSANNYITTGIGDALLRCRMQHIADCDAVIMNYGTNDLYNLSLPASTVKTNLLALWNRMAKVGALTFQSTILPRVSGAFTTVQAQIVGSQEPQRQLLNAWLRAPITAGSGNSALYDANGTLTGVYDSASYIETDITNATPAGPQKPNVGGLWYCGPGNNTAYTTDGVHPNNLGASTLVPAIPVASLGHYQVIQTRST